MECWEESFCFWMVPTGIFLGLFVCGCFCGICCGYSGCLDSAEDEEKAKKKSTTDTIR